MVSVITMELAPIDLSHDAGFYKSVSKAGSKRPGLPHTLSMERLAINTLGDENTLDAHMWNHMTN